MSKRSIAVAPLLVALVLGTMLLGAMVLGVAPFIGTGTAVAAPQQPAESVLAYISANWVMEYDAVADTSTALDYIEEGRPVMPSRALSGTAVSWSVFSESGPVQTYVSETFTHPGQETVHTLTTDLLYSFPRLSPDGTRLLYVVEEPDPDGGLTSNLYVRRVADGAELFSIANVDAADWSPDGTKIVFSSYGRARFDPDMVMLYAYDVATTQETKVPSGHLTVMGYVNTYSPRWSPSGDWIAFQRHGEDAIDIVLTDPTGSTEQVLMTLPPDQSGLGMEWVRMPDGTERLFVESVEAGGAPFVIMEVPGLHSGASDGRILHGALSGQPLPELSDVSAQHPFYRQIRDLAALQIAGGFDDGSFRPAALVKRAQYAKMISIALGVHDSEWTNWNAPSFPDVPRPAAQDDAFRYPFDYVEEAAAAGLVKGTTTGRFNPWAEISRVQLALMIARAGVGRLEPATAADYSVFTDLAGLSQEARDAIAVVYHNGIITGKTATTFAPYAPATRAHAVTMTWRLMEKLGLIG